MVENKIGIEAVKKSQKRQKKEIEKQMVIWGFWIGNMSVCVNMISKLNQNRE